jgi:hypothetical protein
MVASGTLLLFRTWVWVVVMVAMMLSVSARQMELVDSITSSNWLDKMKLQQGVSDEPGEYVKYLNYSNSVLKSLVRSDRDSFLLKVDDKTVLDPNRDPGRDSVSMRSRKAYGPGTIVMDIDHVPDVGCGARPRAILIDNDNREVVPIDLYNFQNHIGMLTTSNCTGGNTFGCNANKFQACYVKFGAKEDSAVDYLNEIEGMVITVQWRVDEINIWINSRKELHRMSNTTAADEETAGSIPVVGKAFDTAILKEPWVSFNRTKSICGLYRTPIFPKDLKIVSLTSNSNSLSNVNQGFETAFCGDDLEDNYMENPTCSRWYRNCRESVAQGPQAFSKTFWKIRGISVYQEKRAGKANT